MSSDLAISVRGVSKAYTIVESDDQPRTLAEAVLRRARHPLRRTPKKTFWATRDVTFDIAQGEVVGVIGRNGAGKSTLLKILSRITDPTAGEIDLHGRVGSLLEVGTGFHPELTGRENIFLNGAILGMSKTEIRRQFDAIVDFAGVATFLDTPVKRYSSGMYVRLAFAVAAHLESEILVVDEVLAVGDAEFQKKCLGKMKDVSRLGRTVLFVSHNMGAVRALCTSVLFMVGGKNQPITDTATGIRAYLDEVDARERTVFEGMAGLHLSDPRFLTATGQDAGTNLEFGKDYGFAMDLRCPEPLRAALSVVIVNDEGLKVASIQSVEEGCDFWDLTQVKRITCELPDLALMPGDYRLNIELCDQHTTFLQAESAVRFTVEPQCVDGSPWAYNKSHGVFRIARGVRTA